MQKSVVDQSLLEENIKHLEFYLNEEYKCLNSIYVKLLECSKYYNTPNATLFLDNINNSMNNIKLIKDKRMEYINILSSVIDKYSILAEKTNQFFSIEDDIYGK